MLRRLNRIMKIYKVKVNGKLYEVELEAVEEVKGSVKPATVEEKPAAPASNGEGANVLAPIAGKLLDIKVKVGDAVKKGEIVAVIEAMKLENEVPSTADGIVKEVKASKGNAVNNGDVLIVLG